MKIETGKKFEIEIDGLGTVMDYVEDRFIFVIKDAFWNDIELQMARKGLLEIDFVYRYDVAVFLLTLGEMMTGRNCWLPNSRCSARSCYWMKTIWSASAEMRHSIRMIPPRSSKSCSCSSRHNFMRASLM